MKAISLWQPWATLWVLQIKKYETRSWPFPYWHTGPVAIHAAKKEYGKLLDIKEQWFDLVNQQLYEAGFDFFELPKGALIGFCDGIISTPIKERPKNKMEEMFGDWSPGRYQWASRNMRAIKEPIPFKGRQGLFDIDNNILVDGQRDQPKRHRQLKLF